MTNILQEEFFRRDALEVAEDLIGACLVKEFEDGREEAFKIIETEAYIGPEDKACHAGEEPTERTEVMFGPPGIFYVYLIYGMYWMLNVITNDEGHPAGVLIRGVEPLEGSEFENYALDGPGKLTRELDIDDSFDTKRAIQENGLWFEDRGIKTPKDNIKTTSRVGVDYAEEWADKPYRFILRD